MGTVTGISGDASLELQLEQSTTTRLVKEHIHEARGVHVFQQQLLHGSELLQDDYPLVALLPPRMLTLVVLDEEALLQAYTIPRPFARAVFGKRVAGGNKRTSKWTSSEVSFEESESAHLPAALESGKLRHYMGWSVYFDDGSKY